MTLQPTIHTRRLCLRPFTLADAPDVQRLAGAREIAATTLAIPHPYEDGMAEAWIQTHPDAFAQQQGVNFAIALQESGEFCGAIGLGVDQENQSAELGYWIGTPFWGRGYATEAARVVVQYGFESLNLNRIHAAHFPKNPASGRIMQKIGMQYEGILRQRVLKWGTFEDTVQYAILKQDWEHQQRLEAVERLTPFLIRPAAAHDRPMLVQFMAELQEVERTFHPNRRDGQAIADSHLAYLEHLVQEQDGNILVAEDAGELLGFLVCFADSYEAGDLHVIESERHFGYISDLYLSPHARGKGIAVALIRAAEAHLKQVGLPTVRLTFLSQNQRAQQVYTHLGYHPYELTYEKRL